MTRLHAIHRWSVAINGLALAAALLRRDTAALVLCIASLLLLAWSLDRMRHAIASRENRP